MAILFDAIPDVEEEHPALGEHAPRLCERGLPVRREHQAEPADDRAEARVLERQLQHIGFAPFDALATVEPVARIVEHRLAQIGGHQSQGRAQALAKPACDDAGAAGDLQDFPRRMFREALHEVGREGIHPDGAQAIVVLRTRKAC